MTAARRRARCLGYAAAAGPALLGCMTSHGLMQTAHTTPPGNVQTSLGAASLSNELSEKDGRTWLTNTTAEFRGRVGVADRVDVGLAPLYGTGVSLDGKVNLLEPEGELAIAPRVALGYVFQTEEAVVAELGIIASYRTSGGLEPYAALHFTNHWFVADDFEQSFSLAANQRFAEPGPYGDGLVKGAIGLQLAFSSSVVANVEYSHFWVAQNDKANGVELLPSDVFAAGLGFEFGGGEE